MSEEKNEASGLFRLLAPNFRQQAKERLNWKLIFLQPMKKVLAAFGRQLPDT